MAGKDTRQLWSRAASPMPFKVSLRSTGHLSPQLVIKLAELGVELIHCCLFEDGDCR